MKDFMEKEEIIFNTKVYQRICDNKDNGQEILNKASELMKYFECILSFYNAESEVSRINKNAGKRLTRVSEETFEIIKKSLEVSEKTKGVFDITIAPLVNAWKINSTNPKVLSKSEAAELRQLVNYHDIILNEEDRTVMLRQEKQMIDLGGIAKGYIADKVIDLYQKNGVKSAIINIGGNIKVLGGKDTVEKWTIGIYEPVKHSEKIICSILGKDISVVTSGDYERAFVAGNEKYHHILSGATGFPVKTDLKSITIIDESSFKADAYATPLFMMGKYKAAEFMNKNNIDGIMVTNEDEIIISKNLIKDFRLNEKYKVLAF